MKNKFLYILPLFSLALLAGCKKDDKKDAAAEAAAMENIPVEVAEPREMNVTLTQTFPGTLLAAHKVDISARVDGVLKIVAPAGSKVRKGQVIYRIENTKYADAVKQAEANIKDYQSSYDYYSKQYASMQEAFKVDAVSQMELLQAKSNMQQAMASIENAKAALDEARTMMGYCEIKAPFDGTIAMQVYDQGSYINGEASPVVLNTIYNDDVLYGEVAIDDKRFAQMMENRKEEGLKLDSVKIVFDVPLQHEYTSVIDYSAPDVSTTTGTVRVHFKIDNRYGELKTGMYMKVEVPYAKSQNALLIRDASISTDQQGKYVYLVNDSNRVVYTPIEVGELYMDTLRIVTKGVTPTSRYVVSELLKVKDGMKVKPY